MNRRLVAAIGLLWSTSWLWGADSRETLQEARASYKQSVAHYGKDSPQTKASRATLRAARRQYHDEQRQFAQHRKNPPQSAH